VENNSSESCDEQTTVFLTQIFYIHTAIYTNQLASPCHDIVSLADTTFLVIGMSYLFALCLQSSESTHNALLIDTGNEHDQVN